MTEATRGDRVLLGRVVAGIALLGRTGVGSVELAYDDDGPDVKWWCGGNWRGTRMFSERFPYPAQAVDDLLARVVNGGLCRRCGQTTVVGVEVEGLCCFVLAAADVDDDQSYRWVRSCERDPASAGPADPTPRPETPGPLLAEQSSSTHDERAKGTS